MTCAESYILMRERYEAMDDLAELIYNRDSIKIPDPISEYQRIP